VIRIKGIGFSCSCSNNSVGGRGAENTNSYELSVYHRIEVVR
jgi:hypothetical protein